MMSKAKRSDNREETGKDARDRLVAEFRRDLKAEASKVDGGLSGEEVEERFYSILGAVLKGNAGSVT